MSVLISLMLIFCSSFSLRADTLAEPLAWDAAESSKHLGLYLDILEDPSSRLTFDDVKSDRLADRWRKGGKPAYVFGQTESTYWLRFSTTPVAAKQEMFLVYRRGFVNETDYYIDQTGSYEHIQIRNSRFSKPAPVDYRFPIVSVFLDSQVKTHYIRVRRTISLHADLSLWEPKAFSSYAFHELVFLGIFYGIVLAMVFYNLFLLIRLKISYYLFYILFVASTGLFQFWFDQFIFQYSGAGESNPLSSILIGNACFWFVAFSRSFLTLNNFRVPKIAGRILLFFSLAIMLSGFLLNNKSQYLVSFIGLFSVAILCPLIGVITLKKGYKPARLYVAAMIAPAIGITYVSLRTMGIPLPENLWASHAIPIGVTVQLLVFSLALADRFQIEQKEARDQIEVLNKELEDKVQERTAENAALLRYIPQGILSIGLLGRLEKNYSAKLPEILGIAQPGGESFKDMVLEKTSMTGDAKDQAWQAILAMVGETDLAFALNQDKLPRHIQLNRGDRWLSLNLTWNIEVNEDNTIKRLLVTLLDITEEVLTRQSLEEKNRDFEIIKELVDAGSKNSAQFFASGSLLLDENLRLLQDGCFDLETVKILFINTHTLKGAARTLHFKELANLLHELEADYSDIVKGSLDADHQNLVVRMKNAAICFGKYVSINTDVLGRAEDFSTIVLDRAFTEECFALLRQLEEDLPMPKSIKDAIRLNSARLFELIFHPLLGIIHETMAQAEKIAKDLGKSPPTLTVACEEVYVTQKQELMLRNVFIHLLRNSLDHGIEADAVRREKQKPQQGEIKVIGRKVDGYIQVEVGDDGAGLDITRLRELGLASHRLNVDAPVEDIAELIFYQGISTTKKITHTSGRGVGMGAVRRYLEEGGGSVTVRLLGPIPTEQSRYAFQIIIKAPYAETALNRL